MLLLGLGLVVAGCGGRAVNWDKPGTHVVQRGETLYSISFRHGLDHREVARWNGIRPPYRIVPGMRLRLIAPTTSGSVVTRPGSVTSRPRPVIQRPTTPAARLDWTWPADGRVLSGFRAGDAKARGLDITAARGSEVRAAAAGRVVYAGSGLVGFGKVIIVKHDERWLTAYAHVDEFEVREDESVRRGQRIARMGLGPGQQPLLHFEIRLDGQPVDPAPLLPRR